MFFVFIAAVFRLMRLHKNVNASLNRLEKFIFTEWRFHAKRTDELQNSLSETDKSRFNLDIRDIIWDEYFVDLTKGVRRYLNKEKITNLAAAKRKDNMYVLVTNVARFIDEKFIF